MEFKFIQYEMKGFDDKEWQEISELKALSGLAGSSAQVTPVLYKILDGEEIVTPDGIYRIKR